MQEHVREQVPEPVGAGAGACTGGQELETGAGKGPGTRHRAEGCRERRAGGIEHYNRRLLVQKAYRKHTSPPGCGDTSLTTRGRVPHQTFFGEESGRAGSTGLSWNGSMYLLEFTYDVRSTFFFIYWLSYPLHYPVSFFYMKINGLASFLPILFLGITDDQVQTLCAPRLNARKRDMTHKGTVLLVDVMKYPYKQRTRLFLQLECCRHSALLSCR